MSAIAVANVGDTSLEARLWPKVIALPDGCWEWRAARDGNGYGVIGRGKRSEGLVRAHRLTYELLVGPIPAGLEPDHLCRNRWCVNPTHLDLVTHAENMPKGHSYSDAYVNRDGYRRCRPCALESKRQSRRAT